MKELTFDEYAELVITPLFDSIAEGFYAGCMQVAERFGIDPPSKEECVDLALCVWQDEEMYEWVPENLASIGIDVPCEEW